MSSTLKQNKYEIDMCNGTIMDKLISFSLPLMLSGILQLMFNAVDIIVVGKFSGNESLAAVGSTTALINVFTNLFIGISLGANVLAARLYAAGKDKEMSETVHTAIALALVSAVSIGVCLYDRQHLLITVYKPLHSRDIIPYIVKIYHSLHSVKVTVVHHVLLLL